jgi:hypothetical protein
MVEKDSGADKEIVSLAVVDGSPMGEHLGHGIWAARMKARLLI